MNPCWKLSLVEGARYVAVADIIYSALTLLIIIIQLITLSTGGVDSIHPNLTTLSNTSITEVLVAYMSLSVINLALSVVLHRGIASDDIHKCRTFLIISSFSTFFGFLIVIYHGMHLQQLPISLFNSEFFISVFYHVYKIYALVVIVAFVIELNEFIKIDKGILGKRKQLNYQTLESGNQDENGEDEIAKFVFYDIPFAAKHVVDEEQFDIDYESCLEYEKTTSTLKGVLSRKPNSREVALKTLKSTFKTRKHMVELIKEAKLMFYIGNHQHILQLLGICCNAGDTTRGNVTLILETFPVRKLDNFLRDSFNNHLQNFLSLTTSDPAGDDSPPRSRKLGTIYENFGTSYFDMEPFSTINMIQWAYQLSSAMEYLHNKKVVFGNLQAKSLILITISHIKLNDFSFASELWENNAIDSSLLKGKVSWQWTAVECLCAANQGYLIEFNDKTDIYSYGSTLLEIFNMGHMPRVPSNLAEYSTMLTDGRRPGKPLYASDGIYNIMKACWSSNPADRPTFNVITLFFRQVLSNSIRH